MFAGTFDVAVAEIVCADDLLDAFDVLDLLDALVDRSLLRARYAEILRDVPPERVVCYCGSGVTACHLLLAMSACGLRGAKLYVGSWSEWCRAREGAI